MSVPAPASERAMLRSVWERLVVARDVLLVSPKRPDGDSVGSVCGLRAALTSIGGVAVMYCPDPIPPTFGTIPYVREFVTGTHALRGRAFDAIVVVDCGDLDYAGIREDLPSWTANGGKLIVIDHHVTNTAYGDVNCVIPNAASTTEVIWRMLEVNGVRVTPETASSLLFGLITDTDGFTNPATTPSAVATAAALTAAGARLAPIIRAVYCAKPVAALQLWGRALERLRIHPRWNVATTVLLPEDFAECADGVERSEGLSNFLQATFPARAILVLKDEGKGTVRGSFRTKRDDVDVGALAERFGGGGHRKASGFGIPGKIVSTVEGWKVE